VFLRHFGATGDLAHRLVMPALYNLAANGLLPDRLCVVGIARKEMSNDEMRDSLLKGLRQFATRPLDDAIIQATAGNASPASSPIRKTRRRSIACGTGSISSKQTETPAAIACSIWQRRPTRSRRLPGSSRRTGMLQENGAWRRLVSRSRSAPTWNRHGS